MTVTPKLLPLRIRLPYATEEEFVDKYGSNLGRGGVFIATRALKDEGTALAFEFVLADGTRMLRGEGVVVKAQVDEGGGRSGMTVRFVKLDAPSKALIDRLVTRRTSETPAPLGPASTPAPIAPTARAEKPPAPPTPPPAPGVSSSPSGRPSPAPPPGLVRRASAASASSQAVPPPRASATAASSPLIPTPIEGPPVARGPSAPATPPTPLVTRTPTAAPEPRVTETPADRSPEPELSSPQEPAAQPEPRVTEAPAAEATAPRDSEPPAVPAAPSELRATETPAAQATPPERHAFEPSAAQATPPEPRMTEAPAARTTPPEPRAPEPLTAQAAPPEPRVTEEPAPRPRLVEAPRAETPASTDDTRRSPEFKGRRRTVLEVPLATPVAPAAPEVVLGIDLGTTQARVAVFHEREPQLIPAGGTEAGGIPSMMAVDDAGQLLVGRAAQAEAERTPRNAATGLKRVLGLRARSPRLRSFVGLPFSVTADARGDASIELRGRAVPLADFAAQLLRELKSSATSFLGREATRAVLCVPAHFDARQRGVLREAAERAGLHVLRILNAPAAATLAYGHGRGLARKRVLVIDLGGGGLEVSVMQVTGDDLEVVTTGCEPMLGGMDFDARIAEALNAELRERATSLPETSFDLNSLRTAAETAKIALSQQQEATVPLRGMGQALLSRERIDALTADLAQRVTEVTREVLESSSLTPQGLDAVLLVGGQSRSPLVRQRLEASLGVTVRSDVDPLGAAALGAALLGRSLLEIESGKPGATVSDVLSMPLGVAERGGTIRRVFERNTRLPANKTLVLPVTPGPLSLALFQGLSPLTAENEYLGALHFQLERAGEAELHFSLSQDGLLLVSATLPGAKPKQPVALAAEELDDAAREALITRSPYATETEQRPAGLLSGLRKFFGKR
ncbi:MAG TPA: TIGR02266 family protein [Myxococcaceae bacterium]|nr:TIGR02266 family protein [Myxococcaceae bacterium]